MDVKDALRKAAAMVISLLLGAIAMFFWFLAGGFAIAFVLSMSFEWKGARFES